jgi:hypothetical protein
VDVIEKATWILGATVFVLVVLSSYITKPSEAEIGPGLDAVEGSSSSTGEGAQEEVPQEQAVPFNEGDSAK